jgi:hypothetical protein
MSGGIIKINEMKKTISTILLAIVILWGIAANSFALETTDNSFNQANQTQKTLLEILKVLLNFGSSNPASPSADSPQAPAPTFPTSTSPPTIYNGLVYYPQCSGPYDNYPLPSGCTICKAGCGPTTVAMILSSYYSQSYTPPKVVSDVYRGHYVGCEGSNFYSAFQILGNTQTYGLKVSDYWSYNRETINGKIASEFRSYIDNGWTLFTLANFGESDARGHFFWIIDIDSNNNVWAFDPYYGRFQIPFNENKYGIYPKYRYVFGVRKN